MPITVEVGDEAPSALLDDVFGYFAAVDARFSTYKSTSEISAINSGALAMADISTDMREVLEIAECTKAETDGCFDVRRHDGSIDPSGIVKGWAIRNAACLIASRGYRNFYVEAGGDIQSMGTNVQGGPWVVGIRNPFNEHEIIKAVALRTAGMATSGSYVRGDHIYDPHHRGRVISDIVSLTVIGPDVLEADRFATAAFAMGADGIYFIEDRPGLEGYMVDAEGIATSTTGFGVYVVT